MSRGEESIGYAVAEKFLALLIIIIGIIVVYYAATTTGLFFPVLFAAGGLGLVTLGILLILARAE